MFAGAVCALGVFSQAGSLKPLKEELAMTNEKGLLILNFLSKHMVAAGVKVQAAHASRASHSMQHSLEVVTLTLLPLKMPLAPPTTRVCFLTVLQELLLCSGWWWTAVCCTALS